MADVLNINLLQRKSKWVLGIGASPPTLVMKLFTNQPAPFDCHLVNAEFTECTAPGYAAINFVAGNWQESLLSCIAQYTYPPINVALTGPGMPPQTIYGHYVLDLMSSDIMWAALWPAPFVIPNTGGTITINVVWQDKQFS